MKFNGWRFQGFEDAKIALIEGIVTGVEAGERFVTLLGATGTGKTATMAFAIERLQRPALVIAHNKTLAAQLCNEFREFFPDNAVEYFVSYYDYYQPEAYIPRSDTYIAKDADINDEIDKLRHAATKALFERRDTIIVASISCIYGLGEPGEYQSFVAYLYKGRHVNRNSLVRQLVSMQYARNDVDFHRGTFRVRGDTVEIIESRPLSKTKRWTLVKVVKRAPSRTLSNLEGAVAGSDAAATPAKTEEKK